MYTIVIESLTPLNRTFRMNILLDRRTAKRFTGRPKKIVTRLRGCCGGAVDAVILVSTQLHVRF